MLRMFPASGPSVTQESTRGRVEGKNNVASVKMQQQLLRKPSHQVS